MPELRPRCGRFLESAGLNREVEPHLPNDRSGNGPAADVPPYSEAPMQAEFVARAHQKYSTDGKCGIPCSQADSEAAMTKGRGRVLAVATTRKGHASARLAQVPSRSRETVNTNDKSLESWIWDAACSIRGAQEAPKFKDFILPLIFTKRLCDVFDDELNRIAQEVGSRAKAFKLVEKDHKLVRFYLPLKPQDPSEPVWAAIRKLTAKIGERRTTNLHDMSKADTAPAGIDDPRDFN